jgi:hypothetical protein
MDPVRELIDTVMRGFCAEIVYKKPSSAESSSTRVVAPLKLVEGADGLLVRAIQISPENGLRTFKVGQIVQVRDSTIPLGTLAKRVSAFCSGEVKTKEEVKPKQPRQAPRSGLTTTINLSLSTPANEWRSDWFLIYLNALRNAMLDMRLEDAEVQQLLVLQDQLQMSYSQICSVHAYLIGQEMLSISIDGEADESERDYLEVIQNLLSRLGWPIRS